MRTDIGLLARPDARAPRGTPRAESGTRFERAAVVRRSRGWSAATGSSTAGSRAPRGARAMSKPARAAAPGAATKSRFTRSMSAASSPSAPGWPAGTGSRRPRAAASGRLGSGSSMPSQTSLVEPFGRRDQLEADLRRACARGTKSTMRATPACAPVHMPAHPGVMRASGDTHVISVNTRPGAADARGCRGGRGGSRPARRPSPSTGTSATARRGSPASGRAA